MCLLALYYLFKGRLLEGHFHASSAVRFGVAMGFHQLNSRIFRPTVLDRQQKSVIGVHRWQPSDAVELGEAINVWWYVFQPLSTPEDIPHIHINELARTCFTLDFGASVLNGLPQSLDPSDVTTVWPCPINHFENVRQNISVLLQTCRLIEIRTTHYPTITTPSQHYSIQACLSRMYRRTALNA